MSRPPSVPLPHGTPEKKSCISLPPDPSFPVKILKDPQSGRLGAPPPPDGTNPDHTVRRLLVHRPQPAHPGRLRRTPGPERSPGRRRPPAKNPPPAPKTPPHPRPAAIPARQPPAPSPQQHRLPPRLALATPHATS